MTQSYCNYLRVFEKIPVIGTSFLGADMVPSEATIENLLKIGFNTTKYTSNLIDNTCIVNIIRFVFMISYFLSLNRLIEPVNSLSEH